MQRWQLIQGCAAQAFSWHLGDPTWSGLALTALYVLALVLFLALTLRPRAWAQGERLLWTSAAFLILALTFNKQLDLQQSIIWTGRCVARAEGWFDQRLVFQRAFGSAILAAMALGLAWLGWASRTALAANQRLLLGLGLMLVFLVIQITRFEQMAGSFGQLVHDLRLHRVIEGLALVMLISAAWRRLRAG